VQRPRAGWQVRAAAGYVPQDDVLPGTSTVWEFLCFHAALRLPGGTDSWAAGASRVRALLRQLSLSKVRTCRGACALAGHDHGAWPLAQLMPEKVHRAFLVLREKPLASASYAHQQLTPMCSSGKRQ
jgi:hypothetical protein